MLPVHLHPAQHIGGTALALVSLLLPQSGAAKLEDLMESKLMSSKITVCTIIRGTEGDRELQYISLKGLLGGNLKSSFTPISFYGKSLANGEKLLCSVVRSKA